MAIYLRGRIWWIKYRETGKTHAFSLSTTDKHDARAKAAAIKEMRNATRIMRKAQSRIATNGLGPGGQLSEWAAIRWSRMNPRERMSVVFVYFQGRCQYCHREVTIPLHRTKKIAPHRAVMDHKIPLSSGGPDTLDNIVLACNVCNTRKLDGSAEPLPAAEVFT
jgi:5-methylcytosine-specific restriction endonuclease McrA